MRRKGGSLSLQCSMVVQYKTMETYFDTNNGSPEQETSALPWYAVRVRSNFETTVSAALRAKGWEEYLPTYRKPSRRIKNLELPLFPGYVFCRLDINRRLGVLTTPGVVNLVSFGSEPLSIPHEQIEAVRAIVRSGLTSEPWPCLRQGDRVRMIKGALAGIEGLLVQVKADLRMVVSIPLLNRAVAVEVNQDWLQLLSSDTQSAGICSTGASAHPNHQQKNSLNAITDRLPAPGASECRLKHANQI